MSAKFHFSIDRGGTFTDIHCRLPNGKEIVRKLLSVDPTNYKDAPTEGIRRILHEFDNANKNYGNDHAPDSLPIHYKRGELVNTRSIGSIRMGTTVATNALLERQGERIALVTTKGFADLLEIGNQSRPNIFDLSILKPGLLYEKVVEIDERVILTKYIENTSSIIISKSIGITGEEVGVIREPNQSIVKTQLQDIYDSGIRSLAIVLIHSFTYSKHEEIVSSLAKQIGFTQISLSSEVMRMIKIVPRGHTACASAYLTPCIELYLQSFRSGFDANLKHVQLTFMKSDGGLTSANDFRGHQAILSGPAAGVIGYAKTTYKNQAVIGFDMGGTSTDVSRYAGSLEHVFETTTAGIAIQAPQLDINTVAAGGGSRLFIQNGMFVVGPKSAGAHPGPVSYRKNGFLAVTDANLVCGRILPHCFPAIFGPNEDQPLDLSLAQQAFLRLRSNIQSNHMSIEEMALGFLKVANEAMCRPIRNLTQMKGFDITTHMLAVFGGAGPQHACAMAKNLGIKRVFIHRYGGVLSAYGLSLADAVLEQQEPTAEILASHTNDLTNIVSEKSISTRFEMLSAKATSSLLKQGYSVDSIRIERFLNLRYDGTDTAIMIKQESSTISSCESYQQAFIQHYQREFGFILNGRDILIDDYRVRAVVPGPEAITNTPVDPLKSYPPVKEVTNVFFQEGWRSVNVYDMEQLLPGHCIPGPAIIIQSISTVILETDCSAIITSHGDIDITILTSTSTQQSSTNDLQHDIVQDPIQLSIFSHRFMGIAEQMGRTLERTAISVNIKERLDFSCAIFSPDGGLVANAPHIPVHLGAMQFAVKFQMEYWNRPGNEGINEGDVMVSNHPQLAGGSHLPDITVITPVFFNGEIIFFLASRGHHADIGGIAPGSMPPHSKSLKEEGAMIIAFKLVKENKFQEEEITNILFSPGKLPGNSGTRNLKDNLSDLKAQVAANNSGISLLLQLVEEYNLRIVHSYMKFIQENAEIAVRTMLKDFATKHGNRTQAIDYMDDGSPIQLSICIDSSNGSATFDFTGTGAQVLSNHNAPPAVTYSAVIYSLRSLINQDIPLNQGCLAPIEFIIPKYTLLNPSDDAAVVGGNVLTSQRVVDVVLRAFKACAASQGCMNNLTFGDEKFGYYETIAGGAGAGPGWNGKSGVHTHCTNTRITDPEILERRYPVILHQFGLRSDSGGNGKWRGGEGVIREIEPLRPLIMSILSERRCLCPYGMNGGKDGGCGRNLLITGDGRVVNIGGRCSTTLDLGQRLRIETPGGGGYGSSIESKEEKEADTDDDIKFEHGCGSLSQYNETQLSA